MTALAKFLVLLNIFAAVAIATWSVATYVNRIDPKLAVDAQGEKLLDKFTKLSKDAADVQTAFPARYSDIEEAEAEYASLKVRTAKRLEEALIGSFVSNPIPTTKLGELIPNPDPKDSPPILGLDAKPLRGRKQMQLEFDDTIRRSADATREYEDAMKKHASLSPVIVAQEQRADRLKGIEFAHIEEIAVLRDERVNWESRTVSLQRRRNQLVARLAELEAGIRTSSAAPNPIK